MKYQKILADYFENHMSEILQDLKEIISIKSVADVNSPQKPFGAGSRAALDWGMKFMENIFATHALMNTMANANAVEKCLNLKIL